MSLQKLFGLSVLSGLLTALAWLEVPGVVLFFSFIPLLIVEQHFLKNANRYPPFSFWPYALITMLIWNFSTSWWIWYATPVGAVFAITVNSILMSLVWALSHIVKRYSGNSFGNLFFLFGWISFEYLHFQWDMSWPWLTLGNGLANIIPLIQWYEFTGVFGGTFWIIILNLLIFKWIELRQEGNKTQIKAQLFVLFFVIFIPIVISLIQFFTYTEESNPMEVVIAQPNIDPYHEKFSEMSVSEQLNRLLSVSDSLGDRNVDFFIGPETALHDVWENNYFFHSEINEIQDFLHFKYPKAAYVVGAMSFLRYPGNMNFPHTARFNSDSTLVYDVFNTACFITADKPIDFYHKTKLVSGVEKMPFKKYLGFMEKLILNLGGTSGTLGTNQSTELFFKDSAIVAVPICYESVYGEYLADFVKKGANLIFVITNDGWWNNSPGYRQHLAFSQLRAVELRRSIARSANTGISAFIDQRGIIVQQTNWWVKTALKGVVNLNTKQTFYTIHGDYIARFSVFILLLFFIHFNIRLIMRRK
jgi:apolipoprotein N-acyltransferase